MKFRELKIEHYGLFSDRSFTFDRRGFQLIYGPNEAGKSTLLQLIRETLFGFPPRTPYAFASHAGSVAARALVEMGDGTAIRFRRRKGNKDTFAGQLESTGERVEESRFKEYLGVATGELYSQLFGFSLAELSAGEKGLKDAGLDETLYGSSLGRLGHFQTVRTALEKETTDLFKPTGKKPKINFLLDEIKKTEKELNQIALLPADYQKQRDAVEAAESKLVERRDRREACRASYDHLKRLKAAWEPWNQRQVHQKQLDGLPVVESLRPKAKETYEHLLKQLAATQKVLDETKGDLDETQAQLKGLDLSPELVELEGPVRKRVQDLERMRLFRQEIPLADQKSKEKRRQAETSLVELLPGFSLERLDTQTIDLATCEKIQQLADRFEQLERNADRSEEVRTDRDRRRKTLTARLDELKPVETLSEMDRLIKKRGEFEAIREAVAQLDRQREEGRREIEILEDRLTRFGLESLDDVDEKRLPSAEVIDDFTTKLNEAETLLKKALARREEIEEELTADEARLVEWKISEKRVDRAALEEMRRARDAGWALLRRRLEGEPVETEAVKSWLEGLADFQNSTSSREEDSFWTQAAHAFEQLTQQADRAADRRLELADQVARQEQLVKSIDGKRLRRDRAETQVEKFQTQCDRLQTEWLDAWGPVKMTPGLPAEMRGWRENWDGYQEQLRRQAELEGNRTGQLARMEEFQDRLSVLLSDSETDDTETLWDILHDRIDRAREVETVRDQAEKDLVALEEEIEKIDRKLQANGTEAKNWKTDWRSLLEPLGLPWEETPSIALKILAGLDEVRRDSREAAALDEKLAEMSRELGTFESEVETLCQKVDGELARLPAEDGLSELERRVEKARQAACDQETFSSQKRRSEERFNTAKSRHQEFQEQRNTLLAEAGVETDEAYLELAELAERRATHSEAICQLEKTLGHLAVGIDFESFLGELASLEIDELRRKLVEAEEACHEAETQYDEANKTRTLLENELKQLDQESRTTAVSLQLESRRAELQEAVDRYAPLVLAQTLLAEEIERFQREHQPALLQETQRLFATMTDGRYPRVSRLLDKQETILVEQADGTTKRPEQLSTGTREQLYLAIRLASLLHYRQRGEPLPVVMDDVLVNFDDDRIRRTVRVLAELPEEVQVLFLTCHESMVSLVEETVDGVTPLRLMA